MPVMGMSGEREPERVISGTVVHPQAWSVRDVDATRWHEQDARSLAINIWLGAQDSPNTRDAYRRDMVRWSAWCDAGAIPFADARRADVDGWRQSLEGEGLAPAGIARRLSAVSSFYRYWTQEDAVARNPAANAKRPKVSADPSSIALTRTQASDLMAAADEAHDPRDGVIVRLLAQTGMRVGELTGARVEDLAETLGHRVIPVTRKGGKVQQLPIATSTYARLREYVGDRPAGWLLFVHETPRRNPKADGRMDRSHVRKILRRLAREAELSPEVCSRMHPHVLRHSAATLLAADGVPPHEIQVLLGHADLRTTQRYIHHAQSLDASPVYRLAALLAR